MTYPHSKAAARWAAFALVTMLATLTMSSGGLVSATEVRAPTAAAAQPLAPILPQATVDVTMPASATTVNVAAGGLQAAIDAATPGTTLVLAAGSTHQGPITLPDKAGSGWITITTAGVLPAGVRVGPADAPRMARILGGNGSEPSIRTAAGAHHYRLIGLELAPAAGLPVTSGVVRLGTGTETSAAELPRQIVLDRCYIHGDASLGGRRGIAANGASIGVIESYVSNWRVAVYDAQAFASWGGPGPFLLRNSYFEASGENIMFGGADTAIANLVPSDITIVGNDFVKPLDWRARSDALVKNLLELKNARRVLLDGNRFTNNWLDGQTGTAINLKSTNQDGTNPWAVTEHVTFTNNVVSHVGGGIVISTQPDASVQTTGHILIRGNVFTDVSGSTWGGSGQFLTMLGPVTDVVVDGNRVENDGNIIIADGSPMPGFVFTNNVVRHNANGVKGSGTGIGTSTLDFYFPQFVFTGNEIVGGSAFATLYPSGNSFPGAAPAPPTSPQNVRIVG